MADEREQVDEQTAVTASVPTSASQQDSSQREQPTYGDLSSEAHNHPAEDEETEASEDSLTYSNGVIEKIVAMATREVPHILGMKGNLMHLVQETLGAENLAKGVSVEVTDDNRVVVNISVIIEYGCYAPAIFDEVKNRVTERLEAMTGLEVAGINLRIEDVLTREEYEASRKKHENSEGRSTRL